MRLIVRNELEVSEVRKGASCYYASAKTNQSHVTINVACLAKRIRDVASYTVDLIAFAFIPHPMYREVSGAFRATFSKPSRMKSPVVVLVKTFVYCRVTLRRYSRPFHLRSYLRCHHSQVPSLSLFHTFNSLFSDFNHAKSQCMHRVTY